MRGFPTEGTLQLFGAGYENGRITGATWTEFARNLASSDALRGVDDFQDRETAAVANVEGFTGDAVNFFQRADVRISNIEDVDVIADAGSVGRGIVRAENIDVREIAGGGVKDARDEMSFDAVILTAFLGGTGSIEITKHGILQASIGAIVRENPFEYELGFAVGIDGRDRKSVV